MLTQMGNMKGTKKSTETNYVSLLVFMEKKKKKTDKIRRNFHYSSVEASSLLHEFLYFLDQPNVVFFIQEKIVVSKFPLLEKDNRNSVQICNSVVCKEKRSWSKLVWVLMEQNGHLQLMLLKLGLEFLLEEVILQLTTNINQDLLVGPE